MRPFPSKGLKGLDIHSLSGRPMLRRRNQSIVHSSEDVWGRFIRPDGAHFSPASEAALTAAWSRMRRAARACSFQCESTTLREIGKHAVVAFLQVPVPRSAASLRRLRVRNTRLTVLLAVLQHADLLIALRPAQAPLIEGFMRRIDEQIDQPAWTADDVIHVRRHLRRICETEA
jgi:hypothetical protein